MHMAFRPENAPPDLKTPTVPEMMPLQRGSRGVVFTPVCINKVRSGPASANQSQSTVSQGSCHVHDMS